LPSGQPGRAGEAVIRIKGFGYRPSEGPEELERQRTVWATKPQLRSFYEIQVFRRILRELPGSGPIVEVGSGAGTFKAACPRVIATDVIEIGGLDLRCTGLHLPFARQALAGVVAVNVLHHLPAVGPFLTEAARTLRPGGRLVCVEPWVTPLSRVFYRWCHQEEFHPVDDALLGTYSDDDRPMHGNTFVPYQALRDRMRLRAEIPGLSLRIVEPFACLGWALSLGFREGAFLPDRWLRPLLRLEDKTSAWWGGLGGLNALLVFEALGTHDD
jgi:SAM-dependent methyltransferase